MRMRFFSRPPSPLLALAPACAVLAVLAAVASIGWSPVPADRPVTLDGGQR